MSQQKRYGQFFTKNICLQEKVFSFIKNNPLLILEPCIGRGDLVGIVKKKLPDTVIDMFEIDSEIGLINDVFKSDVMYCDFLKVDITKQYSTIIGNPPYVRTKGGNLYIDFIDKCYNLLEDNGELIFIVPSDFFKLTSSSKLLNKMMKNGTFTDIYHPHDEKLFENASIDIIVFRYHKQTNCCNEVMYNDTKMYIVNTNGLVTFNNYENSDEYININEYFDIYVGLVSGCESIFKNASIGNIEILNGENKLEKYIFVDEYPSTNPCIDEYLCSKKDTLLQRRIRKFTEKNWYEWGAPRNIQVMVDEFDKECIYVHNLTRRSTVAFKGTVKHFGGGLLMLKPKKKINLDPIVDYLNSESFKTNFMYSGRFKIGHRQISNSSIPIKCL